MSLINDALKRASQSEKDRPREAVPPGLMLPAHSPRRSLLPALTVAAVVLLMAAAGWLILISFSVRRNSAPPPVPVAAKPAKPANPAPPPKPEPAPKLEPALAPVTVLATVPVPAPAPPPPLPVVSKPPPASNPPVAPALPVATAPFPELKLEGIFYNSKNPKIIINGEIRGENETIGEVLIVKISPTQATVQWNGQTKDLRMVPP